jgi:nickel/cobalt exporter
MSTSVPLLIVAAGAVGFLHSILPDHWVPLAVIARTQHWSIARVARVSLLASVGHVVTSLVIAAIIATIGLQFRAAFEAQQGHIVGAILILTGIGFLIWALSGHGGHHHGDHDHEHDHHEHGAHPLERDGSTMHRIAAIAGPFGAAASPDLTILPVALAASAIGTGAVAGCLLSFTVVTLATFVVLTVAATLAGYQVEGEWLEEHGYHVTAVVLIVIGAAVYAGL